MKELIKRASALSMALIMSVSIVGCGTLRSEVEQAVKENVGIKLSIDDSVDNKTDKVIKATEKLSSLFYKGALYYKLLENKNNNINFNKENSINININNEKNENIKNNEKKVEDNNNEEEEDSGDSSFGL